MSKLFTPTSWLSLMSLVAITVTGCSTASDTLVIEEAQISEEVAEEEIPTVVVYRQPEDCLQILPEIGISLLKEEGLELTAGPGSPSGLPIYVEGETPEELVGGLSCLFAAPGEDESSVSVILGSASITTDSRSSVINELLEQQLNVGQSSDGALTYWKWGDEDIVPALHNSIYTESWLSALMQPGGRESYEFGLRLVELMRKHSTE